MRDPAGEHNLLCEICGYTLAGLPLEGNCPECGAPIAGSLPARRPGSPWQQDPGPAAWARTSLAALARSGPLFDAVRIETRRSLGLLASNLSIAALIVAAAASPGASAPELAMAAAGSWAVLAALTAIEGAGLILFGRRRRWRVTPAVAAVVCAHASAGWIPAAALGAAGALAMGLAPARDKGADLALWVLAQSLPLVGFSAGLLVFETLVYIGVRRCRFANRAPPGPAA